MAFPAFWQNSAARPSQPDLARMTGLRAGTPFYYTRGMLDPADLPAARRDSGVAAPKAPPAQVHAHAHGLAYSPNHTGHTHAAHGHAGHAHPPAPVSFSLLRLSGVQRLAGALCVIAVIWTGVFWAMA